MASVFFVVQLKRGRDVVLDDVVEEFDAVFCVARRRTSDVGSVGEKSS